MKVIPFPAVASPTASLIDKPRWASPQDKLTIVEICDGTFAPNRFAIIREGERRQDSYHAIECECGYSICLVHFNADGTLTVDGEPYAESEIKIDGCVRELWQDDPVLRPDALHWVLDDGLTQTCEYSYLELRR